MRYKVIGFSLVLIIIIGAIFMSMKESEPQISSEKAKLTSELEIVKNEMFDSPRNHVIDPEGYKEYIEMYLQENKIPENGYVSDEETAKKIAESIWLAIYGESIYNEKPYNAYYYKE